MKHLEHSEKVALDFYLSNYPADVSFEKIIDLLTDKDQPCDKDFELLGKLVVWHPFENFLNEEIVKFIQDTQQKFEYLDRVVNRLNSMLDTDEIHVTSEVGGEIESIIEEFEV
jgi:hypothetical protein